MTRSVDGPLVVDINNNTVLNIFDAYVLHIQGLVGAHEVVSAEWWKLFLKQLNKIPSYCLAASYAEQRFNDLVLAYHAYHPFDHKNQTFVDL